MIQKTVGTTRGELAGGKHKHKENAANSVKTQNSVKNGKFFFDLPPIANRTSFLSCIIVCV